MTFVTCLSYHVNQNVSSQFQTLKYIILNIISQYNTVFPMDTTPNECSLTKESQLLLLMSRNIINSCNPTESSY